MRFDPDDFEEDDPYGRRLPQERFPAPPERYPPPPPPTGDGPVVPDPGSDDGFPDPGGDPDFGTFEFPVYSGPSRPNIQLGPAPRIGPAPQFNAPRFEAPSYEDAINDPGYRFRAQAGSDAMERSAAARGTLRTGGTLKDLAEWNQNFATQEYRGVFDRELQGYDRNYRASYDEYAPRLAQWHSQGAADLAAWQARSGASQAAEMAAFERAWAQYVLGVENARWREEQIQEQAVPTPGDVSAHG
jgi:hypothetical protein